MYGCYLGCSKCYSCEHFKKETTDSGNYVECKKKKHT